MLGRQWDATFGQQYRLDFGLVRRAARDWGLRTDRHFYRRLAAYEAAVLAVWQEAREKGGDDRRGRCSEALEAECRQQYGAAFERVCTRCERRVDGTGH